MARRRARSASRPSDAPDPDAMALLGHELRTPLNAILGFGELMQREAFGPIGNPRYAEYVRLIGEGARQMLATVDALHRLAHLGQGRVVTALAPVALAEVAVVALEGAAARAGQRGVALVAGRIDPRATALGDVALLLELVSELVENAIGFTPAGGRVELAVRRRRVGAIVTVADTGVGIPRAARARVFEPFIQLKPGGVPGTGGPGLGLPLAAALARLHRGSLGLAGRRGGGTVATLTLPGTGRRRNR